MWSTRPTQFRGDKVRCGPPAKTKKEICIVKVVVDPSHHILR